jgi:hypothetical protein
MRYLRLAVASVLGVAVATLICTVIISSDRAHFFWIHKTYILLTLVSAGLAWIILPRQYVDSAPARGTDATMLALITCAAGLPLYPFFHDGILGGSDARWYASVVADFIEQWRTGFGPVFVGQSRYAAIGTVMPARVAPLLQHLSLLIDLLTLRSLSPYLLLNLAVSATGTATGALGYLCLRRLSVSPIVAWHISVLYVWCPAALGLPYMGQLFMSYMAIPFLILLFYGVAKAIETKCARGLVVTAIGCAGCFLAHTPIGFWASVAAVLALAIGLRTSIFSKQCLLQSLFALTTFFLLCGYVFVSVFLLKAPKMAPLSVDTAIAVTRASFPATIEPVTEVTGSYTDVQLGWPILLCGFLALVFSLARRRNGAFAIAAGAVILSIFSFPWPYLTSVFWRCVPTSILTLTNTVPFQRFFPILAAMIAVSLAAALAGFRSNRWLLAVLSVATAWSGFEASHFSYRGKLISNSRTGSDTALSAENLTPAAFSTGMLSFSNAFFSHGFMQRELEQRILSEDFSHYLSTNLGSVAPGYDFNDTRAPTTEVALNGIPSPTGRRWIEISPALHLIPHSHYVLALSFAPHSYTGVLIISGETFHHEYPLPQSGLEKSFGAGSGCEHAIPLDNDSDRPIDLSLGYEVQDPSIDLHAFSSFCGYRLILYDPAQLPCHLVSLLPYSATVRSPEGGWYESFRYFVPGWKALVNGRPESVVKTTNGLIAVHVPAGTSAVSLYYEAPWPLAQVYWLTALSWLVVAIVGFRTYFNGGITAAV